MMKFYRYKSMTKEMTEQEVHDLVQATAVTNVGALIGRRPPFYTGFSGKEFTLRFDACGPCINYRFIDDHKLVWNDGKEDREEYYEALQIDKSIFLIAHLRKGTRPQEAITLTVDMEQKLVTGIFAHMGNQYSAREVTQNIYFGVIETGEPVPFLWRHHFTRDLIGRSMGWSYRDDMMSQHIYGAPNSLAWIILTGPGAGLMHSAPARYIKINDHVYIVTWVEERSSGQQGVAVINLQIMHDVGTFYGIPHGQIFEFYTYGAKGYSAGSYNTKDLFVW